ncbi:serine/threonine-protein kinase [Roseofilum reptotaenium CS-1145]|uniref:Serine/threonine protein kinase n=1 Tax=Roseofilum reptotaenium AO1-A TaxID=1925591 RepID=A0A1L9QS08_9CYAN|nr:serine/threonine-protein kinase [Roseofilum reptotaenium]MDB9515835.1 serine/threonine-protein kinase [Roseofilum reptotaenium CS-1145]OJJ25454.1 serine/threonine protein kinase [Roseofilum reptotaenium AO1-A]
MLQPEQVLSVQSTSSQPLEYQLHRKLGRTAAGRQTWLATDLRVNEPVTLKLLAFNPQMPWDELKLFEREAQVLQALDHPCIPEYRDYFSLDQQMGGGVPWFGLVQEYIPGVSLQEQLENGARFSEEEVKEIAASVLKILIYLHRLSPPVLHRDIKPSNIILGEDREVYLVDFGAVQSQAAVTGVTFTVVGTSGYAPLEQFWGRAVAASDLYALGATLIHVATGVPPVDLPHRENRIQFRDRSTLNPYLITWIEKMTDPALEKRFSSAQEAFDQLYNQPVAIETAQSTKFRHVPKPDNTLIYIWRSPTTLKLEVPSRFQRNTLRTTAIVLLCLMIIRSLFISILSLLQNPIVLLVGFLAIVTLILLFSATEIEVTFEKNSFKIEKKVLGYSYLTHTGVSEQLMGVFIHHENSATMVKLHCQNPTGEYTYAIAGALSPNEAAWLTHEIQDWLYLGIEGGE